MNTDVTSRIRPARGAHLKLLLGVLCVAVLAATPAGAQTIKLVNGETGADITGTVGYKWTLERDTTYHVVPGQPDSTTPTQAVDFHVSYYPVVAQGCVGAWCESVLAPSVPDDTLHYFLSVLPESGYTIGGAQIAPGQTDVTVYLNPWPIPTAQISLFVFEDNFPINNAPDLPEELGIEGWQVVVEDAGGRYGASAGQNIMDAFGNPLGTTYVDGCNPYDQLCSPWDPTCIPETGSCVDTLGTGMLYTGPGGRLTIKNLAPGKYGIIVVPPAGQGWQQTSTIEGTKVIDAWVKAREPEFFAEFGPPGPHVFIGFTRTYDCFNGPFDAPTCEGVAAGGNTISGQITNLHISRPPATQFFGGAPIGHTTAWVALNDLSAPPKGKTVFAGPTGDEGLFSIAGVPDGSYELVAFDNNQDVIIGFVPITIGPPGTVPPPTCETGVPCDLGEVPVRQWFTRLENFVFYDDDGNGYWDSGESGLLEQNVNVRWRDGTINQAAATDGDGFVPFDEVFPFFAWLVAEVDFARFKATGATVIVDDGGEIPTYTENLNWPADPAADPTVGGQLNPQLQPDNGEAPYRIEEGTVLTQGFQGFLGQTSAIYWGKQAWGANENGGISGMVYYAVTRAEDDPRWAAAEVWEPGIPGVTLNLYTDYDLDGLPDNGAIMTTVTDSWDADKPTGCVYHGDQVYVFDPDGSGGQPPLTTDCFDGLRVFNQVRPGVFDGGYAFGPEIDCTDPGFLGDCTLHTNVGADLNNYLKPGGYIVEAITPDGYTLVKEEDRNVDFGDEYVPSGLLTPPECVGAMRTVPADLTLFPGVEVGSGFGGTSRPLCDKKQVLLSGGANAAAEFFYFTEASIAGHIVGFILDDTANEFDPRSPQFGEKYAPPWLPVSIRDFNDNEVARIYSDQFGRYNVPVPSTFTANLPMPSGMSPNMLTACMNHAVAPDPVTGGFKIDDWFNEQYSQFCYTFQYMPGATTYLDTPVVPAAAFAGPDRFPLDCELPDATPMIHSVNGPANQGPVANSDETLTIQSMGTVDVPNPDFCDPAAIAECPLGSSPDRNIPRDYGFGEGATATLGGVPLICDGDTNTISCTVLGIGAGAHQLLVTRAGGATTEVGVTVTVGETAAAVVPTGGSIQAAIDAASPGDLITVEPGLYQEMVIMWKPVRLQGWGAGSVLINAINTPNEKLQLWRDKIAELEAAGEFDLLPGQEAGAGVGFEPATLGTEQAPAIIVLGKRNGAATYDKHAARIDGLGMFGSSTGGGVLVNGYGKTLQVSNNRIENNTGFYGGGVRLGYPLLTEFQGQPGYTDAENSDIAIHHNQILRNSSLEAGGGIALYTGSDGYQVYDNYICGNFAAGDGAGIGHVGLSDGGRIADNTINFNENFNQGQAIHGGGILIGGSAPIAVGEFTEGAGNVAVERNLILGNMAGAGDGGGIALRQVNGQEVRVTGSLLQGFTIDIFNNTIANNIAGTAGGGISLADAALVNIHHNTLFRNDSTATTAAVWDTIAKVSTPQPAGIMSYPHSALLAAETGQTFSDPDLRNSIVMENRSFSVDANSGDFLIVPDVTTDPEVFDDLGTLTCDEGCLLTSGAVPSLLFVAPAKNTGRAEIGLPEGTTGLQISVAPDEGGNFIRVIFGLRPYDAPDANPLLSNIADYHLLVDNLAAVDAAADVGVVDDIDGGARPAGAGFDIGSDEVDSPAAVAAPAGAGVRAVAKGRRVGGGS